MAAVCLAQYSQVDIYPAPGATALHLAVVCLSCRVDGGNHTSCHINEMSSGYDESAAEMERDARSLTMRAKAFVHLKPFADKHSPFDSFSRHYNIESNKDLPQVTAQCIVMCVTRNPHATEAKLASL